MIKSWFVLKIVVVLLLGYIVFMKPWECVKERVSNEGGGSGMNGDLATWIDCSY